MKWESFTDGTCTEKLAFGVGADKQKYALWLFYDVKCTKDECYPGARLESLLRRDRGVSGIENNAKGIIMDHEVYCLYSLKSNNRTQTTNESQTRSSQNSSLSPCATLISRR